MCRGKWQVSTSVPMEKVATTTLLLVSQTSLRGLSRSHPIPKLHHILHAHKHSTTNLRSRHQLDLRSLILHMVHQHSHLIMHLLLGVITSLSSLWAMSMGNLLILVGAAHITMPMLSNLDPTLHLLTPSHLSNLGHTLHLLTPFLPHTLLIKVAITSTNREVCSFYLFLVIFTFLDSRQTSHQFIIRSVCVGFSAFVAVAFPVNLCIHIVCVHPTHYYIISWAKLHVSLDYICIYYTLYS